MTTRPFPAGCALALLLLAAPGRSEGQALPPGTREALESGVGDRVVVFSVLGGVDFISGGAYSWRDIDESVRVFRIPLRYEPDAGQPYAIGETGLRWSPVFQGEAGYVASSIGFDGTPLEGSDSESSTYILGLGGGARLHLADAVSLLPAFEAVYSYSSERFHAGGAGGAAVQAADGSGSELVDWSVHAMTFVPQVELRLGRWWDGVKPELTSRYAYYRGVPLQDAPDLGTFEEDSQAWISRAGVEARTPWTIGEQAVRVGVSIERSNLYGGLERAMRTGAFQTAGARLAMGVEEGLLGPMDAVGLGGGYTWSSVFTGWAVELRASIVF